MQLMDADVCIDILRDHPQAVAWITALSTPVRIPGHVAIELIVGCFNRAELVKAQAFLAKFSPLIWPADADMTRAVHDYAPLRLSHGLGGFDALIAATAVGRGAELLTFHARHFSAVPGLAFSAPYIR